MAEGDKRLAKELDARELKQVREAQAASDRNMTMEAMTRLGMPGEDDPNFGNVAILVDDKINRMLVEGGNPNVPLTSQLVEAAVTETRDFLNAMKFEAVSAAASAQTETPNETLPPGQPPGSGHGGEADPNLLANGGAGMKALAGDVFDQLAGLGGATSS